MVRPDAGRVKIGESNVGSFETPLPANHAGNICVFCSASLTDPAFLADGEELGRRLAQARLGCVSGAGKSGIMGAVVKGAVEAVSWTAGSNVPHVVELEGSPEGLSQLLAATRTFTPAWRS
ncbi:MAG: hypothetical protein QM755_18300 [Luteolibacter sp.]